MINKQENTTKNAWIDDLETFKWWKKRHRRSYLDCAIFIIFFEVVICIGVFQQQTDSIPMSNLFFGISILVMFGFLALFLIYKWIKSYSWKVDRSFRGTVIEKNRYSMNCRIKSSDRKAYYVIAKSDSQIIEGLCIFETYRQLDIGSPVLLFSIGSKEIFAIPI